MKQIIWMVMLMTGSTVVYGQRTEFSGQAGSGLFSFRGPGAVSETRIYGNDTPPLFVLGNPYGRRSGFSYSVAGQIQHITRSGFIYGVQAGYESLTSRVGITTITYAEIFPIIPQPTAGWATLRNQYVNVQPFVGKRFGNQHVSLDVTAGADLAGGLSSHEQSESQGTMGYHTTDMDRPHPSVDLRPRVNLTGYYRAFGLSLGYSHGLTKYTIDPYSDNRIYGRMWRVGVVYRLGGRA